MSSRKGDKSRGAGGRGRAGGCHGGREVEIVPKVQTGQEGCLTHGAGGRVRRSPSRAWAPG